MVPHVAPTAGETCASVTDVVRAPEPVKALQCGGEGGGGDGGGGFGGGDGGGSGGNGGNGGSGGGGDGDKGGRRGGGGGGKCNQYAAHPTNANVRLAAQQPPPPHELE